LYTIYIYEIIEKIKTELTAWKSPVDLPFTIEEVKAIKIRWLYYVTASSGNKDLQLSCDERSRSIPWTRAEKSSFTARRRMSFVRAMPATSTGSRSPGASSLDQEPP